MVSGFIVLDEIASKALSPGANNHGIAKDVIAHQSAASEDDRPAIVRFWHEALERNGRQVLGRSN